MPRDDIEGFLTTLGREFCIVLQRECGISDASGHDCYGALTDALGNPVTLEVLQAVKPERFARVAEAMNSYFETTAVQPSHVEAAIASVLWHWRR